VRAARIRVKTGENRCGATIGSLAKRTSSWLVIAGRGVILPVGVILWILPIALTESAGPLYV
jgi:hypothetical protein